MFSPPAGVSGLQDERLWLRAVPGVGGAGRGGGGVLPHAGRVSNFVHVMWKPAGTCPVLRVDSRCCGLTVPTCVLRLRSAYPHSDRSRNAGFLWSPSVGPEELHQGLGISVKVTVVSEHFREPLTFTCDSKTLRSLASVKHMHTLKASKKEPLGKGLASEEPAVGGPVYPRRGHRGRARTSTEGGVHVNR